MIRDIIKYRLKQEGFKLLEDMNIFVKNKNIRSAIGLKNSTNEIFIKYEFIELIVKQCLKEMIEAQIKDLTKAKDGLL